MLQYSYVTHCNIILCKTQRNITSDTLRLCNMLHTVTIQITISDNCSLRETICNRLQHTTKYNTPQHISQYTATKNYNCDTKWHKMTSQYQGSQQLK